MSARPRGVWYATVAVVECSESLQNILIKKSHGLVKSILFSNYMMSFTELTEFENITRIIEVITRFIT